MPKQKKELDSIQPRSLVNLVTGIKGGVGKSTVCRLSYQYHLDRGIPVIGFEANPRNPDFSKFYPEIEQAGNIVKFTLDRDEIANVNLILNTANKERKNIVVNMPADCEEEFALWLESFNVLEIAEKINYKLVNWFVCSGEPDSTESLKISLKRFPEIPHIVVRNQKFRDWQYFDSDKELQELLRYYKPDVITVPALNTLITGVILKQRLSYGKAREYSGEGFDFLERSAVEGFLNRSYAEFEKTQFFPMKQLVG